MFGAFKTLATVLVATGAAKVGRDQYNKYRDAKRKRQVAEVHQFISSLDLDQLQKALKSEDVEVLVDAVSSILSAANDVREKSEFESLREDLSEATKGATDSVKTFFADMANTEEYKKASASVSGGVDKVQNRLSDLLNVGGEFAKDVGEMFDGIKEQYEQEMERQRKAAEEQKRKEEEKQPTFDEFMKGGKLKVNFGSDTIWRIVDLNSTDIFINPAKKTVRVPNLEQPNNYKDVELK